MSLQTDLIARLSGEAGPPVYLPDLTLWYDFHRKRGTLPEKWHGYSLPQVARAMHAPIWAVVQPWQLQTPGTSITTTEHEGERVIRAETAAGTLVARWTLGPAGDWWQTEYPVKREADLLAALELARARTYMLDPAPLAAVQDQVGSDGIVALEIPRRPFSDLLHQFLGWAEGLFLLGEPLVADILAVLEEGVQRLVAEVAGLPGQVVISPDNLDGQFISPALFDEHLAGSYHQTAGVLHGAGKRLVVHIGGPVKRILPALAAAGVDVVEGIAGPPQSDLSLAQARVVAGAGPVLWGGIPQDYLLDTHSTERFEGAINQAVQEAAADGRMLIGVADRVPVDADVGRLEALPGLVAQALA